MFLSSFDPANFEAAFQSIKPSDIDFKAPNRKIMEKTERYKLATDASFIDKFNYVIFRIWNAIKAIFNQSDWQLARKEIVKCLTEPVLQHKDIKPFADMLKGHMPQILKTVAAVVDAMMCLSIDSKIDSYSKNPLRAIQTLESLKKPLLQEVKTHAGKIGVDPELIDPIFNLLEKNQLDEAAAYVNENEVRFMAAVATLKPKAIDGSIVDDVLNLAKGIFRVLATQNVVDSTTRNSIVNALRTTIKTLGQLADDKALLLKTFVVIAATKGLPMGEREESHEPNHEREIVYASWEDFRDATYNQTDSNNEASSSDSDGSDSN